MTKRGLGAILFVLLPACDPGGVVLLAPTQSADGGPGLSIHVAIDTPYAALAGSLGWTAGVPEALVRVHRMADPYDEAHWRTAAGDSTGLAVFAGVLSGLYEVAVRRVLSAGEQGLTGDAVGLVAGGRRVNVSPGAEHAVTVAPDRRGSLVFSEFGLAVPLPWETNGSYYDAKYVEVFNNGESTIYLDGKYWGDGWDLNLDFTFWPCNQTEGVRNDPGGIWAARVFRFPGSGGDYPLEPGKAAVIAKAAVDHRAIHPDLYDLRDADFEFGGGQNADNPDVPNMQFVGIRPPQPVWPIWRMPMFLSIPADVGTLPRYVDPYSGAEWVRIPTELVLDASVATVDWTAGSYQPPPACREDLHRTFERLAGPAADELSDVQQGVSAQRRVLNVLPDGRKRLQDTNTSMVDFVKAPRSPGWIPDSLP